MLNRALILLAVLMGLAMPQMAELGHCSEASVNIEKMADAIYYVEGGAKTSHPYGVLTHYKHTTARQACINTIKHALRDWNGQGSFIAFLGSRYCPTHWEKTYQATKAEYELNRYWVGNVTRLYERSIK
jgi:hypothetical protein